MALVTLYSSGDFTDYASKWSSVSPTLAAAATTAPTGAPGIKVMAGARDTIGDIFNIAIQNTIIGDTVSVTAVVAANQTRTDIPWLLRLSNDGTTFAGDPPTIADQSISASGWITRTISFTATSTLTYVSIGTFSWAGQYVGVPSDGILANFVPGWIGSLTATRSVSSQRLVPATFRVGTTIGTVSAGDDSRFPQKAVDSGVLLPRMERLDMVISGNMTVGINMTRFSISGGKIWKIAVRAGFVGSGANATIDFTTGGLSIFANPADRFTISDGNVNVKTVNTAILANTFLGINVDAVTGTVTELTVSAWVVVG